MIVEAVSPVALATRQGLLSRPRALPPWLFYDQRGSELFEQITLLPEYYLTRTERHLFEQHATSILLQLQAPVTIAELGAGSATKTGILLAAATRLQGSVLYQAIDVSPTALQEARENITAHIPGITVRTEVANYVTEPIRLERLEGHKVLSLYIGSSIGNFSPEDALSVLARLRAQLLPGDALLLGTDLAPGPDKPLDVLLAAYNDADGVTAAFNLNLLARLNRELGSDFDLARFAHKATWNPTESRIEMHLVSQSRQIVHLPADPSGPTYVLHFAPGESIHTENSYKFTSASIGTLLAAAGFQPSRTFTDPDHLFAVTLAEAQ